MFDWNTWLWRLFEYWRQFVGIALFLIITVSSHEVARRLGWRDVYIGGFLLALAFWLGARAVHELGHVAAAMAVGWRVHMISVLSLNYMPRRWQFTDLPRVGFADLGGYVFATPAALEGWERGATLYALGGLLANIAVGALVFAAVPWSNGAWLAPLFWGFGIACFAMGVANALPTFSSDKRRSDGMQVLVALLDKPESGGQLMGRWLYGQYLDGVPAKDWSSSLVWNLQGDFSLDHALRESLRLIYYLAVGDLRTALKIFDERRSVLNALLPNLAAEYAYVAAVVERDGAKAEIILSMIPPAGQRSFAYWRAKAVTDTLLAQPGMARYAIRRARHLIAACSEQDEVLFQAIERDNAISASFGKPPA